jgi:NADH dehydrogenase
VIQPYDDPAAFAVSKSMVAPSAHHRVVIVGGGFGGLSAARRLRRVPVEVTLVDRQNYHLFQPLLYQVATGTLSPANIASPLRSLLKRHANVRVLLGDVTDISIANHTITVDGVPLPYDTLVLAAGSRHSYFGHDEWEAVAPGLKTIDDATAIRRRILESFEIAEWRAANGEEVGPWMTFVVIGAGPTGVELAGQIAEIARHTLVHEFRLIDPTRASVYLIEAGPRVLAAYTPKSSEHAAAALAAMGVTLITGAMVTCVDADGIAYTRNADSKRLESHAVFWAAGNQASPLAKILAQATGATLDRSGRIAVEPDMNIAGHPDIFVIGDMALRNAADGKPLPALAPVALQQGKYVADVIAARLAGKPSPPPYRYRDLGTMATIGRSRAVCEFRFGRVYGTLAWLMWLFVHLMSIVEFQNRVLVFFQWAWAYFTRNRAARLITGHDSDAEASISRMQPCGNDTNSGADPSSRVEHSGQSAILSKKP